MKITYTTAARCLLFLAACLPAAAQVSVNASHNSDGSSQISANTQEAQVKALQQQLESYQQQLRAKAQQVENARQEAISAGIQGDGAGPSIDAYRQEQKEMEALQADLAPKIERTCKLIANLTTPVPLSYCFEFPYDDGAADTHGRCARQFRWRQTRQGRVDRKQQFLEAQSGGQVSLYLVFRSTRFCQSYQLREA